jgi:glycosyltransferase involved in cell wall biosynthesis
VQPLKLSIITVTYNAEATVQQCIESVIGQNYNNVQYIIIDGASTDNTQHIINKYRKFIDTYVSEPDNGMYDAMNKGIALADGDIIGILNADDYFADANVLANVAQAFYESKREIVYGNIDYIDKKGKVLRKWRSGQYHEGLFNWGWMPPHPAFYALRKLFDKHNVYSLHYGTAADYELMLRLVHRNKAETYYLDRLCVKMLTGGRSNQSLRHRFEAWKNDYKAMKDNNVRFPSIAVMLKPIRKMFQYV